MDELREESPLLPVVLVLDYVDRLSEKGPFLLSYACAIFAWYAVFGHWKDLWMILCFGCWNQASFISWWLYGLCFSQSILLVLGLGATVSYYASPWWPGRNKALVRGRLASEIEKQLEVGFCRYLQHLVSQAPDALVVSYVPSGTIEHSEEVFHSASTGKPSQIPEHMEVRVLSPVFYSRFVHYAHDFEAMFSEMAEHHTVAVDKPALLPKIFLKKPAHSLHTSNVLDFLYFQLIKNLRRRPRRSQQDRLSASNAATAHAVDIRNFRISSMDAYILGQDDVALKKRYRSALSRLFIADRVVSGNVGLLYLLELAGRIYLSWTLAFILF